MFLNLSYSLGKAHFEKASIFVGTLLCEQPPLMAVAACLLQEPACKGAPQAVSVEMEHRVNSHQFFSQLRALVVKNQCSKVAAQL